MFGGYGLALAALALVLFGAIECPPERSTPEIELKTSYVQNKVTKNKGFCYANKIVCRK